MPCSLSPCAVGVCGTAPQAEQVLLLVFTYWTRSSDKSSSGFRQQPWDEVQELTTHSVELNKYNDMIIK